MDELVLREQLHDEGENAATTEGRITFVQRVVNPIINEINYMSEKQEEVNSYVSTKSAEASVFVTEGVKKISVTSSNKFNETLDMIRSIASGKK